MATDDVYRKFRHSFYHATLHAAIMCPSVTTWCSTKMAKPRITKTTPYDSAGILSFLTPKISAKFQWGYPQRGRQTEVG